MPAYAHSHSIDGQPWEPLFTPFGEGNESCQRETCQKCRNLDPYHGHLNKAAWWTARFFFESFSTGTALSKFAWDLGYFAGLWHDLGKFHPDFQRKLKGERLQISHSGAGALLAKELGFKNWEVIAFVIAGHHCGLANVLDHPSEKDRLTPLEERLNGARLELTFSRRAATEEMMEFLLMLPVEASKGENFTFEGIERSNFIRMLFSALVDADSVVTEAFCSPTEKKAVLRHSPIHDTIEVLHQRLSDYLDGFSQTSSDTPVNRERRRILSWCREAALLPAGFFQLNVPTGGGKTLSGLAFALRHLLNHQQRGMRRVVIAVPYTSIIEQNAGIYRAALGEQNVIEHHSNLDEMSGSDDEGIDADERVIRHRLACEDWNVPVVITTNVQLFESLFTHKRSRARKLHNLAGSVIILDEAQCVPAEYLQLILYSLQDLVKNYGCSVVVSTATQPAWKKRNSLPFGIVPENFRSIIPEEVELARLAPFDRVDIEWPQSSAPTPYAELADLLADEPCVMAIVHRKSDAQLLTKLLRDLKPSEKLFHLSTNMCPVHRRLVLGEIHKALKEYREIGEPCRVISTQLIECGVDVSFPVVFRAIAGLDAIVQAAGRANRSGEYGKKGRVVVFVAETDPPDGHLKHCAEVTQKMLDEYGSLDTRDSSIFQDFFVRLYLRRNLDGKALVRHAEGLNFETLGREFRMIEEGDQTAIVVLFDEEARKRVQKVDEIARSRDEATAMRYALRALQPYTVLVRPKGMKSLRPALRPLLEGGLTFVLDPTFYEKSYDEIYGLTVDDEPIIRPDKIIV